MPAGAQVQGSTDVGLWRGCALPSDLARSPTIDSSRMVIHVKSKAKGRKTATELRPPLCSLGGLVRRRARSWRARSRSPASRAHAISNRACPPAANIAEMRQGVVSLHTAARFAHPRLANNDIKVSPVMLGPCQSSTATALYTRVATNTIREVGRAPGALSLIARTC